MLLLNKLCFANHFEINVKKGAKPLSSRQILLKH